MKNELKNEVEKLNPERKEGPIAKAIESQTSKLPSDLFLWSAVGSMVISAGMQAVGKRQASLFVGQWAPAFLILGLYNKVVKVAGSDASESRGQFQNRKGTQTAQQAA